MQNLDTDDLIDASDSESQFYLQISDIDSNTREQYLKVLRTVWEKSNPRAQSDSDLKWTGDLFSHIDHLIEMRISHVQEWINSNLSRFKAEHASIDDLRRRFEVAKVELRANSQICRLQCASCQLLCVKSRFHDLSEGHSCMTSHECPCPCDIADEHPEEPKKCGYPWVVNSVFPNTLLMLV